MDPDALWTGFVTVVKGAVQGTGTTVHSGLFIHNQSKSSDGVRSKPKTRLTNVLFDMVNGYWGDWQCNRIYCSVCLCCAYSTVSRERGCNLTCQMECLRILEKYVTWFQSCNPCNPAALLAYCIKSNYYSNYWFKILVRGSHILSKRVWLVSVFVFEAVQ